MASSRVRKPSLPHSVLSPSVSSASNLQSPASPSSLIPHPSSLLHPVVSPSVSSASRLQSPASPSSLISHPSSLIAWFDKRARKLPWRLTRDPYAIWLSEVMLQQTRVDTVIPYYERFLACYPTVRELAAADLDQVLSLWSGLGYYRRARVLHRAAREVMERYGGVLPSDPVELRTLPGIGAYTAGAIASIAFDRAEPLVDGNVARVLSRLSGFDEDIRHPRAMRKLWEMAAGLVPANQPGRFNQALMELGATVCTPRNPRCDDCPVRKDCVARATCKQHELPLISPKKAVPSVAMVSLVVRSGDQILLGRRREGGLFGGLWEPPMIEARSLLAAKQLLGSLGFEATLRPKKVGHVCHILTHRRLEVTVVRVDAPSGGDRELRPVDPYEKMGWFSPQMVDIGMSTLARKILNTGPAERTAS